MKKGKQLLSGLALLGFLLGIHDGYIALWKGEDPQPVKIFPYRADALPAEDQKRLEQGIRIGDEGSVTRILEDYCS